ncbi:MAG: rhomboid family intramembrane serine protease [Bacteroidales bacterium]|nr:rhomboid family intramembrane serine protease [Bacteroidales bacterium]
MYDSRILPPVVKNLLIINVICYLATMVLESRGYLMITNLCALNAIPTGRFYIWQPITYMFMHANFEHIFFNMFALWMFGKEIENYWGSRRFLVYYMVCGVGAAICNLLVPGWHLTVGASGAVYGLLLAFGMMFPNDYINLYFIIPIKAKWFVVGYAAIELFSGLTRMDGVAHFAHLGGMLFGLLLILYWRKHPFSRF